MNDTMDLLKARGELRQFLRALQEDAAKNVIPYGNDETLSDNVWVHHAEMVQEFVRLNPQWTAQAETLTHDCTRKYRLNRDQWLGVKKTQAARVDAAQKPDAGSVQFVLETEPMAEAFQQLLRSRCGQDVRIQAEQQPNGDYLVHVWPKSAAESAALTWLCEGFKHGYHWGKKEPH